MNSSKFTRDQLLQFCDEIYPDDGMRRSRKSEFQGISYHQLQLAKQLHLALDEIFLCEIMDPTFDGIRVLEVNPIDRTPNMMVIIDSEDKSILNRINRIKGLIRSLAAEKINRKRMPDLKFGVV